jgi:dihydrofolate reductase
VIISLVVAMDVQRGIGYENRLPWRLSADLKRFKQLTMGHTIIMGRNTYESIGRALPGRTSIVLSRDPAWMAEGTLKAAGMDQALEMAQARDESEVFIIGGGAVFSQVLDLADRIYLTQVDADGPADTFFPEFDESVWEEVHSEEHPRDEKNEHAIVYRILSRTRKSSSS